MKTYLIAILVSYSIASFAAEPIVLTSEPTPNSAEQVEPPTGTIKKPTEQQLKSIKKPKKSKKKTDP